MTQEQQDDGKLGAGTCPKCSAARDGYSVLWKVPGIRWWLCGTGAYGSKFHQSPKCRIAELESQLAALQSPPTADIDLAGIAERWIDESLRHLHETKHPWVRNAVKESLMLNVPALLAHVSRLTAALQAERERCAGLCEQLMNYWPDERPSLMRAAVEIRNGTVNVAGIV